VLRVSAYAALHVTLSAVLPIFSDTKTIKSGLYQDNNLTTPEVPDPATLCTFVAARCNPQKSQTLQRAMLRHNL
jgi:hypothetical protein